MATTRTLHDLRHLATVVGIAVALIALGTLSASAETSKPQRYPRVWNADGTAQCFPDGCDPFGLCCS